MEDNLELSEANTRALRMLELDVHQALTLTGARTYLAHTEPDVILLDVMLPDGDGMDFCGEIRSQTTAHILFLTAKTELADIVRGLNLGGDDYITKPFHPKELLARVEAAVRRKAMEKSRILKKGVLVLDLVALQAYVSDIDLLLQPKEFALLQLFVQNENKVMDAEGIYQKVWGRPLAGNKSALQAAVSKLRKKIAAAEYDIATVRNTGYLFRKSW